MYPIHGCVFHQESESDRAVEEQLVMNRVAVIEVILHNCIYAAPKLLKSM